ncbi:Pentatricopeptide repeat-containing protein At2g45350, chloroplastic [Ancistrocladus abbreviatus]
MVVSACPNQPWNSTLPTLHVLQHCKTFNDVKQIHARLITTGLIENISLTTKIVLRFCSSHHTPLVQFARFLFLSKHVVNTQEPHLGDDPFVWNAVAKSFSHGHDDPKQAVLIFSAMLRHGVSVDKYSFSLVLKACSRIGLLKEGMQIHGLLKKLELESELYLENCLICLYLRCGCVASARLLFDRMCRKDSVSYNLMIDGYTKCGMVGLARLVFDSMPEEQKNLISWNSMINGYVGTEDGLNAAWKLFEKMPERDLVSWNRMIDGLVKCGRMEIACELFNQMPERDVIGWATMIDGYAKLGKVGVARNLFDQVVEKDIVLCNAMMAGYVQNQHCTEALELFHNMIEVDKLLPDKVTLSIVLSAIAQLGRIDEGMSVHHFIEEYGLAVEGKLGVALIDMYSKCGSIDNAVKVFENLEEKNVDHWNAMIGGLAIHGLGEVAFELFMEMERLLLQPDDITFIGVLNACGHAGLVKEGQICFELMRRVHEVEPKLQHYGCMVDILGRAGYIEEARNFILEMPIEPNDVVWRTLLSHCRNYENFYVGQPVAEHLISLDNSHSGSYVLLSNICAGFGMWNDVNRIRTMMRRNDMRKIPGCSSVELEGVVHEFFVRDISHPQVGEIYFTLDSSDESELTCIKH